MAVNLVINQRHLQIQLKQLETVWPSLFPGLPGQTFTVRADSTFRQEGW